MTGYELFAEDLRIKDVGRTVRSLTYRDKNKTTKPDSRGCYDPETGRHAYRREPRTYTIESIYAHKNGNILINSGIYLRPKTIVEFVDDQDTQ